MKKNKISKNWVNKQRRDTYVRQSKVDGYRARSAYKLIEIDEKFKIFKGGMNVIDIGAAPGSWSQYVSKVVKSGKIISIDLPSGFNGDTGYSYGKFINADETLAMGFYKPAHFLLPAKQHMGKLVNKFSETNTDEIILALQKDNKFDFKIEEEIISLDSEDFIVDYDANENFAVANRDGLIVFISTSRNKEMMAKGLVKDVARRLQTLRKERGYNPTDVLEIASILELDEESLEMIKEKSEELAFLVRVKKVNFEESCKEYKQDDIDGQKIRISVE